MVKNLICKIIYIYYYFTYIIAKKLNNNDQENNTISKHFLEFNNRLVLKRTRGKVIKKIALLLPHCIQNYSCSYKITSDIENCRKCGLCKISDILQLKEDYRIEIKVATGGTIARLFLKKESPDFVIAVACERDLISGLYDAFPMAIYGVFNIRKNGPCMNTDLPLDKIKKILQLIGKK